MVNRMFQQGDQRYLSLTAEDSKRIKEIMSGLIGKTCWKARLSYGDELSLHFGDKRPYSSPRMAGKYKGSWILGTRATQWRLDKGHGYGVKAHQQIVSSESPLEEIRDKIHVLENERVTFLGDAIPLNYFPPSRFCFSNGYQLSLNICVPNDPELAYYELFTPNNMLLKVGGATPWSYISANSPVS